jgi:hypothetical protein
MKDQPMTNPTKPLTRAQAIALATEMAIDGKPLCQPNGCHEDDIEPNSGDVEGWWTCKKCGSALTSQVAQAFMDEPLSYVNQAIQWMHAGTIVLHVQTMITGRITRVHKPNKYRDKGGNVIDQHVVEFVDGNAFILAMDELMLVPLMAYEANVLKHLSNDIRVLIVGTLGALRLHSAAKEVQDDRMAKAVLLLRAALTQQLRALGT